MDLNLIEPSMTTSSTAEAAPAHKILIISNDQELIFHFISFTIDFGCEVISHLDYQKENGLMNLKEFSMLAIDANLDDFSGLRVVQLMNEIRQNPLLKILHITTDLDLVKAKTAFLQSETDYLIDLWADENLVREKIREQLNGMNKETWSLAHQTRQDEIPESHLIETKDIIDSLNYAAVMQKSLCHCKQNDRIRFQDCFIISEPKDIVGGDFHWLDYVNHKQISVCADCTGHGVPGAMLTMMGHQIMENIIRTQRVLDPGEILTQVHQRFLTVFGWESPLRHQGMDVSICVYDPDTKILEYASGRGKILLQNGKDLVKLDGDLVSVGDLMKPAIRFKTNRIQIKEMTWLFQYTDGIVDQFGGGNDKKYKFHNLKRTLRTNVDKESEELKDVLWQEHLAWKGPMEQTDDLTFVGYKIG